MKSITVSAVVVLAGALLPTPSFAQTEGRIGVGVAVTRTLPAEDGLDTDVGISIQVQRTPRQGFGFTGALSWYGADVEGSFAGVSGTIAHVSVRPLMGGVGYTFSRGRAAVNLSAVLGPSLNRLRIDDAVRDRLSFAGTKFDKNVWSIATRVGVGATYAVRPRLALTGFGGYLFNRPKFRLQTGAGEVRSQWTTDGIVISAGVIYSIF
jgi:hypothetical protein